MSTTYKPALLKALTLITRRDSNRVIQLSLIGAEFTRLYWNQTVIFHLRQAAVISKEPEVIHRIRAAADGNRVRDLRDLPTPVRTRIDNEMAKILRIDVLKRFHASKPVHMPLLFSWTSGEDFISLPQASIDFLTANSRPLETLANYWWAKYLEKVNWLAPAIIDKVERDGARRSSLTKYLRILRETDEHNCFYCGRELSAASRVEVDHVLPWTFLLSNELWDLVLSCAPCNSAKSDRLPERRFVEKLALTNAIRAKRTLSTTVSPLHGGDTIFQLYDAAIAVEWPRFWSPTP